MAPLKSTAMQLLLVLILCSMPCSPEAKRGGIPRRTDMHFYMHDVVSGPGATVVPVATAAGNFSKLGFGTVFVIDDLLTRGPVRGSRVVGRAQGMYTWSSKRMDTLMLLFTCVFHSARYNGSSVSIQGADAASLRVREVAVVGGSGHFRYATGYATIETHSFSISTAVLKFNVTILH